MTWPWQFGCRHPWCWLHDLLPCRWGWLCWRADRIHYPDLLREEYDW